MSFLVFNRVYRLEIQSVMLVFSTQLCELFLLQTSLWFASPTPPPLPKVKVQYTVLVHRQFLSKDTKCYTDFKSVELLETNEPGKSYWPKTLAS
jgi:hypothetical protein